ncbi:MAG: 16S rRNA (guanine(527)-N(7))-methyltransferase RsmG [bacterium]
MEIIKKYFPRLESTQEERFAQLLPLYREWNQKINVISRKDMDNFYTNHVLHSLAVAKILRFVPGTRILDVGTGGGFPGIPLAIMFPQAHFYLLDSIEKKIKVVHEVAESIGLDNVTPVRDRAENAPGHYDFIVSRAVTALPKFTGWVKGKIAGEQKNDISNGILYLKGGDFSGELRQTRFKHKVFDISAFFEEAFFDTKKVVHLF